MSGSGKKWQKMSKADANIVRDQLLASGGTVKDASGASEVWRVNAAGSNFTYYTTGTLYSTPSRHPDIDALYVSIEGRSGPRFPVTEKRFLIGCDETGKGEVFGNLVVVAAAFPAALVPTLDPLVAFAETKKSKSGQYWQDRHEELEALREQGLDYAVRRIEPAMFDAYNVNNLLDVHYSRALAELSERLDISDARVVVDDYGIGSELRTFLSSLRRAGAEVVVAKHADDTYLEARVASVLARADRETLMDAIRNSPEFQIEVGGIGSGNAGEAKTVAWLNAWSLSGKPWPYFVKRSFMNVRRLDGFDEKVVKRRYSADS